MRVDSGIALDEFGLENSNSSEEEGGFVSAFGGAKGRSSSLSPRARWEGEGHEVLPFSLLFCVNRANFV